jgi:phosphoribosylformimino-5-aminoimidazole carboxamide ribotide isomerase
LGGGLRDRSAIDRALDLGAWRVMIGSAAVHAPEMVDEVARSIGADRMALAVDMRNGRLAVQGWADASADTPEAFIRRYLDRGIRTFHCTDVSKDGMLQGPNLAWYGALRRAFTDADLIAAGGVTSLNDLDALRITGIDGAVIGRALYEGSISLPVLQTWSRGGA